MMECRTDSSGNSGLTEFQTLDERRPVAGSTNTLLITTAEPVFGRSIGEFRARLGQAER